MVVTDLDGTLLRNDRTISERTLNAIGTLQDYGIKFVIATARAPRSVMMLLIHHIGSTAIPGIYAKPVIDILVGVKDVNNVDKYNIELKKALADKHRYDPAGYNEGKDAFIKDIDKKAAEWAKKNI
jgi:GrpB-like predicted nucleotidyltransferase (UPF0157 family)